MVILRLCLLTQLAIVLFASDIRLRGTVTSSVRANELTIELRSAVGQAIDTMTTVPSLSGQFDFQNVKAGHYVVAVKNQSGETLREEHVWANANTGEVNITMRDEKPKEGHGTVSIQHLNHQVPKIARKAMGRYSKCRSHKDETCAVTALSDAIAADTDLLEAYVNRSALYARTGQWAPALADVDQALRLDPQCALAHSNRAFIAVHQKDYQQAIESSKAVLRTEPSNPHAQYFMALAQLNLGDVDVAVRQLQNLAAEYAPARQTLLQAEPQLARLKAQKESLAARAKSEKIVANETTRVSPKPPTVSGSSGATPKAASAFTKE